MLQERRVIRAGAEGVDAQIDRLADLTTALGRVRLGDLPQLGALPHREFGLGVDDVLRHVVHEALQRVRPCRQEIAPAVHVWVEVDRSVLPQLVPVRLDPLGRAEQARLLAVPGGVDDRAPRLPSLTRQLSQGARLLEQRHEPRDGILGAVHPGVVMVAPHDPLVRRARARQPRTNGSCGATNWSAALAPGSRAMTSYSGLVLQSDLTRRWTFAGPGPMRYVRGSAPRQASGAMGPRSAASSGCASP